MPWPRKKGVRYSVEKLPYPRGVGKKNTKSSYEGRKASAQKRPVGSPPRTIAGRPGKRQHRPENIGWEGTCKQTCRGGRVLLSGGPCSAGLQTARRFLTHRRTWARGPPTQEEEMLHRGGHQGPSQTKGENAPQGAT